MSIIPCVTLATLPAVGAYFGHRNYPFEKERLIRSALFNHFMGGLGMYLISQKRGSINALLPRVCFGAAILLNSVPIYYALYKNNNQEYSTIRIIGSVSLALGWLLLGSFPR
mmetsp:Transcript_6383/g.7181  ORF Transcript_6383/g.7181 Transcript_6383/m.7181 type:complete len:112 (-) Transcript_6383:76-411(-)